MTKIGIIREGKEPPDSRVPLTPAQCHALLDRYSNLELVVQSSAHRCFNDREYLDAGIEVEDQVDNCDILFGVKEVPVNQLLENKTYLFFSHTIKEQPYNKKLLQAIIAKNIRLIDYECLTDEKGIRVIAFGKWAGIVGAHNGLWAWGNRSGLLQLPRVVEMKDFEALKRAYQKIIGVPPIRITITGDGRVAHGAVEVMDLLKIRRVTPDEYLNDHFNEPIYVQLSPGDLYANRSGKEFELSDYFDNPQDYSCDFQPYYGKTDLMINAMYWDPKAPRFFSKEEMRSPKFKIKTIADVSCDIEGSVPATLRVTTIESPVLGYDPASETESTPYNDDVIDIMAVDNLPNELPRDASTSFGEQLSHHVIPELLSEKSKMIEHAVIAEKGRLGQHYQYLSNYITG